MSRSVRTRARQHLPGGGFDSNGNAKQGKIEVWGKIIITDYKHGGETLTPADVGLRTIEWIDLKFDEPVSSADGSVTRMAPYSYSAQQFYLVEGAGTNGQFNQIAATEDPTLSFHVVGDAQEDVELL